MAFNFNWSPLTADASFYTKAQELLTTALNKSPKPPIIVDDILVNELNLGSVPPDLEILEIGDLAEDRFRGIFKMCYTGDAFLTLKTRVQVGNRTKISVEYCSSSLGKPSQYLSIYKTFLHIPSASRCLLRPDDPSTNHTIRNQAVRVHYTGIFKAERSDACVSKWPARIAQGVLHLRRYTFCQRVPAEGDWRPAAYTADGWGSRYHPSSVFTAMGSRISGKRGRGASAKSPRLNNRRKAGGSIGKSTSRSSGQLWEHLGCVSNSFSVSGLRPRNACSFLAEESSTPECFDGFAQDFIAIHTGYEGRCLQSLGWTLGKRRNAWKQRASDTDYACHGTQPILYGQLQYDIRIFRSRWCQAISVQTWDAIFWIGCFGLGPRIDQAWKAAWRAEAKAPSREPEEEANRGRWCREREWRKYNGIWDHVFSTVRVWRSTCHTRATRRGACHSS